MTIKFKILLCIVSLLFTSSVFLLHAEETSTAPTTKDIEEHKASLREKFKGAKEDFIAKQKELKLKAQEKIDELRGKKTERTCELLTKRVGSRIEIAEKRHTTQLEFYEKLKTRLSELINKLNEKGYETSELEADLEVLDEKVQSYKDAHANFIEKLKATEGYTCGESEDAYKEALEAAKTAFEEARTAAAAVHDYFKTEIKEDIKQIRGQKASEGTE